MNCPRDIQADKERDFIGKEHPGGEQWGKGTPENCSATWLTVSGLMVMGFISGLSLANHPYSGSFLKMHRLLSQDRSQRERFREMVGHVVSPFDPSQILPVGGSLLVSYPLPRPPVIK